MGVYRGEEEYSVMQGQGRAGGYFFYRKMLLCFMRNGLRNAMFTDSQ